MDQYTEAVARYPNARFSYVGHSNGTYLLARALADYPAVRFHRVVFAGSVVRRTYDWRALRDRKQVDGVLNFVATADWVVAIFPKAFQTVRLSDLGSAGHDGFEAPVGQVRYVCGGHGAALVEDNWDTIAKFVVDGTLEPKGELLAPRQAWPVRLLGWVAPAVWAGILLGLACVAVAIWRSGWSDPTRLLALLSLAFVVWKILTRF